MADILVNCGYDTKCCNAMTFGELCVFSVTAGKRLIRKIILRMEVQQKNAKSVPVLQVSKGRSSSQGGSKGVSRVMVDHAGPYGWNSLSQPKWTSVSEKKGSPLCAGLLPG